jgi:hypothetical protein
MKVVLTEGLVNCIHTDEANHAIIMNLLAVLSAVHHTVYCSRDPERSTFCGI